MHALLHSVPRPCSRPLLETLAEVGVGFVPEGPSPSESQRARAAKPLGKVNKEVYIGKRKLTTLELTDQF